MQIRTQQVWVGLGFCISNGLPVRPTLPGQGPHSEKQEAKLTYIKTSEAGTQGHSGQGNSYNLVTGSEQGTVPITEVVVYTPEPLGPISKPLL